MQWDVARAAEKRPVEAVQGACDAGGETVPGPHAAFGGAGQVQPFTDSAEAYIRFHDPLDAAGRDSSDHCGSGGPVRAHADGRRQERQGEPAAIRKAEEYREADGAGQPPPGGRFRGGPQEPSDRRDDRQCLPQIGA